MGCFLACRYGSIFFFFPGGQPGALSASSNLQCHFIELVTALALLPKLNCKYALLNSQQFEKFECEAAKKPFFWRVLRVTVILTIVTQTKIKTAERGLVALRIGCRHASILPMKWIPATRGSDTSLRMLTTLPATVFVSPSTGVFPSLWKCSLEKAQQSIDLGEAKTECVILKTVNGMLNRKIWILMRWFPRNILAMTNIIGRGGCVSVCVGKRWLCLGNWMTSTGRRRLQPVHSDHSTWVKMTRKETCLNVPC